MVKRKHITLIYQYNDNWIGGTYYILNIIRALKYLDDVERPFLTVVYENLGSLGDIEKINYPYINFVYSKLSFNLFEKTVNKIAREIIKKPLITKRIKIDHIENLYPVSDSIWTKNANNFFYWIPDFQEHYLSHFFSKRELRTRINMQIWLKNIAAPVVFSSLNALNDFNRFYPGNFNHKEVLKFVSILGSEYKYLDIEKIREKFSIGEPYFIIPNQFWKHKNHNIVLEAAKILKKDGVQFKLIFTGKEYDHRNPDYVNNLKSYIRENSLGEYVKFLGFIDRNEQLLLMKNSISIVQPSLFEGWSTVVEDTKALNHFIILSDIPLHKEQISENCIFFNPNSPQELATAMIRCTEHLEIVPKDYRDDIKKFSNKFISIFNN